MFRSLARLKYFCIPPVIDEREIRRGWEGGCDHRAMIPTLSKKDANIRFTDGNSEIWPASATWQVSKIYSPEN